MDLLASQRLFGLLQVNVDNIDRDLFGRNVKGAMYQPVDETLDKYKKAAYEIVWEAYVDNLVSVPPQFPLHRNAPGQARWRCSSQLAHAPRRLRYWFQHFAGVAAPQMMSESSQ